MIFIIDAEKTSDKTQHSFMIKALENVGIEESYLNIIRAVYNKLRTNSSLTEKPNAFPLK
jgi:DNA polymerase IIIc chi subunit